MTAGLLERDAVLARAEQALTSAAAGTGGLLVVEGQAGMGKTAALAAIRTTATRAGLRVLRARGAQLERDYAFGIVRQLVEPALMASARGPVRTPDAPAVAATGFLQQLEALAEERPAAIVIDDGQWADVASLRCLGPLIERLDELPVALVVAARPEAGIAAPLGAGGVVELQPLSVAAVAQLVGADAAAAVHQATGGVPFLVRRAGEERLDGSTVVNRAVGRWALARLGDPGTPADRLARALAILGDAEPATAAALAELDDDAAEAATRRLLAAGVLIGEQRLRFAQPIVRDGVYAQLSGAERAAGHLRAAAVDAGRAPEHLLRVEPRGEAWIAEALLAAARDAAPETAVAYLRRALAEGPADRGAALLELGLAEDGLDDPAALDDLHAAVEASAPGAPRIRAAIALAGALRGRGRDATAALEIEPRSALLLRLARGEPVEPAPGAPREVLGIAALRAVSDADPSPEAAALARRALALGGLPAAGELPWFTDATMALIACECWDDAEAALDLAVARGDAVLAAVARSQRALVRLCRGDLLAAEADARAALASPAVFDRAPARGVLVESLVDQQRLEEAAAVEAAPGFAQARLAFEQRRFGEAAAGFLAAHPLAPWRGYAALAFAFAGNAERARQLAAEAIAHAAPPRSLGIAQRAVAAVASGPEAEARLREAVATLECAGDALELARAQVDLGALLRRGKRRADARRLLETALDSARRSHAHALVARAQAELDATGARSRKQLSTGLDALTASERRVAELAQQGLTNPEIAQTLVITRRTVEGHLTQVFAKLGVDSRHDLPAALARRD